MPFWENLGNGIVAAASAVAAASRSNFVAQAARYAAANRDEVIGGMSVDQWDSQWKRMGTLDSDFSDLSHSVGLYRARKYGEIVYIGRAIEWANGGLRKRLRDYTRDSDSSRGHASGRLMSEFAADLEIDVLIVGSDAEAADITRRLEVHLIGRHRPTWNRHGVPRTDAA